MYTEHLFVELASPREQSALGASFVGYGVVPKGLLTFLGFLMQCGV